MMQCLCLVVVPTALSIEEQRLLESLDRLNERLKSKMTAYVLTMFTVSYCLGFNKWTNKI